MDIADKQQATYEVLIKRFGPEVGLSLDLYQKVANGTATTAENIDYQKKNGYIEKEDSDVSLKYKAADPPKFPDGTIF